MDIDERQFRYEAADGLSIAAYRWAAAGVEPSHRKNLLTHSTLDMTERYTHIADRGMLDAAEKTVKEILKKALQNNEEK